MKAGIAQLTAIILSVAIWPGITKLGGDGEINQAASHAESIKSASSSKKKSHFALQPISVLGGDSQ